MRAVPDDQPCDGGGQTEPQQPLVDARPICPSLVGVVVALLTVKYGVDPVTAVVISILVGLLMWWAESRANLTRTIESLNFADAMTIGTAQAIALVPGVSRSGITITAAKKPNITMFWTIARPSDSATRVMPAPSSPESVTTKPGRITGASAAPARV